MRQMLVLALAVTLAACNPYMAATTVVRETYGTATDRRSLHTSEAGRHAERLAPRAEGWAAVQAAPVARRAGSARLASAHAQR